jgi:DNA-binding XRE family transcriptional regulator
MLSPFKRASLAKSPNSAYNQFENGVQGPSIESALALCDAFDLTLDWIYSATCAAYAMKRRWQSRG